MGKLRQIDTVRSANSNPDNSYIGRHRHFAPRPSASRNTFTIAAATHNSRRATVLGLHVHIHNPLGSAIASQQAHPNTRAEHRPLRRRRAQDRAIPQHCRTGGRPRSWHRSQAIGRERSRNKGTSWVGRTRCGRCAAWSGGRVRGFVRAMLKLI